MTENEAIAGKITPFVMALASDHISDDDFTALGAFFEKWGYGAFDATRFAADFARLSYGAVLMQDEAIYGALLYRLAGDEAEIIEFAVHGDYRRCSIGTKMLGLFSSHAKALKLSRLLLEVAEDNHGAIALYHSAGFAHAGTRPLYYHRYDQDDNQIKIDAIIMELWLSKV